VLDLGEVTEVIVDPQTDARDPSTQAGGSDALDRQDRG